jgi:two-component sensor histidine kinase
VTDARAETAAPPGGRAGLLARLPTGAKLFAILSIALLPLAIIAVFATLKTSQSASEEVRARLRVAAAEGSRKLAIELIGDTTALRVAVNALDADPGDAPNCARAQGVFAQQAASGSRFVIADRQGRVLCGGALPPGAIVQDDPGQPVSASIMPGRGIVLSLHGASGASRGSAYFPAAFLSDISRPSGFTPPYEARLLDGSQSLTLDALPSHGPLDRRETERTMLGIGNLTFEMQVRSAPITSPLIIAMLLPLMMWAAAASIAWFVVDRLLVDPLRQLRASVAAYKPGEEIDPAEVRRSPAQEIRELGDTFRIISRTVAAHEAGLAEGLVRQTRLTREVHHRVKNNLQVIASLINFHARGAKSKEATDAYASIQRRVDALAVVHRYHFAELEETRGLGLRSVIAELAASIRATAPPDAGPLGILLDIDPYLVTQDVAVAVTFLITELVELAMSGAGPSQVHIALKPDTTPDRAILHVSAPTLVDSEALHVALAERYGRVIEGLSRQLRSKLHYDPLAGGYEISIAVTGRD